MTAARLVRQASSRPVAQTTSSATVSQATRLQDTGVAPERQASRLSH